MKTIYKKQAIVESPYHNISSKAYDFSNPKHPVREEIKKNEGTFGFTATIKEDKQTMQVLKETPGIIGYICTLKMDDQIIGEGRGMAVINKMNKFIERSVRYAFNSSIIDAIVRSVKTMDTFELNPTYQKSTSITDEDIQEAKLEIEREEGNITERQKTYLTELVNVNIIDEDEKNRWLSNIPDLTKSEASESIRSFQV